MHVLDIIVIVVLLLCTYFGYRKGFLYKLLELISLVVSVMGAWYLSEPLSKIFNFSNIYQFDLGHEVLNGAVTMLVTHIICFIILFVLFQIAFFAFKLAAKIFAKVPVVSGINAMLGACLGALQGLFILCLLCIGLSMNVDYKPFVEETSLRFINMVQEPVFNFMKEDIERFAVTMDSISNSDGLSDEQKNIIYDWLLELKIEEGTAEDIIHTLR